MSNMQRAEQLIVNMQNKSHTEQSSFSKPEEYVDENMLQWRDVERKDELKSRFSEKHKIPKKNLLPDNSDTTPGPSMDTTSTPDPCLTIIDSKVCRLKCILKGNSGLRRVMEESYCHHIYHTVAMEGNTLTLAEIRHVIETHFAVPDSRLHAQNEVLGVDEAMKYISSNLLSREEDNITVNDIMEIHRRVLEKVDPVSAGWLRTKSVRVGQHYPAHPDDLDGLMEELVEWLNSAEARQMHRVQYAALAHHKLVHLHPFADGNGRTSRLLMNLVLMQACFPPITISTEQRDEYYTTLQAAHDGDEQPFIYFIARCTETTLDTLLERCGSSSDVATECATLSKKLRNYWWH